MDEGGVSMHKSVKIDTCFCACDSKVKNDEKLLNSMNDSGRDLIRGKFRPMAPSQQTSNLWELLSAIVTRAAPHVRSSPRGTLALHEGGCREVLLLFTDFGQLTKEK